MQAIGFLKNNNFDALDYYFLIGQCSHCEENTKRIGQKDTANMVSSQRAFGRYSDKSIGVIYTVEI